MVEWYVLTIIKKIITVITNRETNQQTNEAKYE